MEYISRQIIFSHYADQGEGRDQLQFETVLHFATTDEGIFTLGDARSFQGSSKIPPWVQCNTVYFDADVKRTTARQQRENHLGVDHHSTVQ